MRVRCCRLRGWGESVFFLNSKKNEKKSKKKSILITIKKIKNISFNEQNLSNYFMINEDFIMTHKYRK